MSTAFAMIERARDLLEAVHSLLACDYLQWIVETPVTWDYRVIDALLPTGEAGYEFAHRLGIIGQVFRTHRAIAAPEVRRHPLYDAYDGGVDWELAIPLFADDQFAGVLNLEGRGRLTLDEISWHRLVGAVSAATGWQPPQVMPLPGQDGLMPTAWITLRTGPGTSSCDAALDLSQRLAEDGKHVIVAGEIALPRSKVYPYLAEALARGLAIGGCARGIDRQLDALPFGNLDNTCEFLNPNRLYPVIAGRYDYCIIVDPAEVVDLEKP